MFCPTVPEPEPESKSSKPDKGKDCEPNTSKWWPNVLAADLAKPHISFELPTIHWDGYGYGTVHELAHRDIPYVEQMTEKIVEGEKAVMPGTISIALTADTVRHYYHNRPSDKSVEVSYC